MRFLITVVIVLGIAVLTVATGAAPLGLVIEVIIGGMIALFLVKAALEGLSGAAGMVDTISCCGCTGIMIGLIVLVIISAVGGFLAGKTN